VACLKKFKSKLGVIMLTNIGY